MQTFAEFPSEQLDIMGGEPLSGSRFETEEPELGFSTSQPEEQE